MRIKKLFLFLFFVILAFISCSPADESESATGTPIRFSAAEVAQTKADGVLTTDNLLSMGVLAYHTKQSNWSTGATPNFMHNQLVGRTTSTNPWTYTPMKYWPNTAGDKVSFFAYAPHSSKMTGLTVSDNTATGYPCLNYTVPTTEASQTDLLAAAPLLNQTRGSGALSFKMDHKLTRVLFKVKSTDAIKITALKVSGCTTSGKLTFTGTDATWSDLTDTQDIAATAGVDVPATTLTQVAEFFLLPKNATGVTVTFTESGSSETLTADLPTSPVWEAGDAVGYTLYIECKTEVTMTVTAWANNSSTGNMGQEVPSGTAYPYALNGVLYESADKAYYVGGYAKGAFPNITNTGDAYTWQECIDICSKHYSWGGYSAGKWRLPNIDELKNIRTIKDINTKAELAPNGSYWSTTATDANNAYIVWGDGYPNPESKTLLRRAVCIRDVSTP